MVFTKWAIRSVVCFMVVSLQVGHANENKPDPAKPEKIVIADTFERVPVNAGNVEAALRGCLPNVISGQLKFPMIDGQISITTVTGQPNQFTLVADQAECVRDSSYGFPLLPIEAFTRRTTFTGVAITQQHNWFRQVATLIATTGKAELAVTTANGGTHVFTYSVRTDDKGILRLGRQFFQPGESRGVAKPQAIQAIAPELSSIVMLERPAKADEKLDAHNQEATLPVFFDASPAQPDSTVWLVRVERSALTGLPVTSKP
jgi:hypothetical protein